MTPEDSSPRRQTRARLLRSTLAEWIPGGSDVAIPDVPVHRNVGDLFIYAATEWLLADLDCTVVYRAGVRDYRSATARRRVGPGTLIVGLGGGNFGDLYPSYQALREQVVADFPRQRIVVLPQTIHYTRDEARSASVAALRRHPDLHIAARDARSLAVARELSSSTALLPDVVDAMGAAALTALAPEGTMPGDGSGRQGGGGTLFLLRRDTEREAHRDGGPSTSAGTRADWLDLVRGVSPRVALAALAMPLAPASASARLHDRWRAYSISLFAHTVRRLRQFDHVVTDRLHGAILSRLAGCPVTLIDNSYGKVAAYHAAWWTGDSRITLAPPADRLT